MHRSACQHLTARQGSGRWAALSFGAKHSVGVSGEGEVYTWGRNDSAQLGHNALQQQPMPMRLSVLRGIDVKAICCGSSVRHELPAGSPYCNCPMLQACVARNLQACSAPLLCC